ncbi:hypothetical protein CHLNCDRAFT_51198 [Chlorella variabilis]|uniref:60S acidic ribosomal protein P2 n=1 Tax=Chlorella variabilis TaxID=554065 RepID=E1ZAY3_CHLVA|nr:hypothetical protein CHLNCDRAFT_51198 [Chlorella variabilis]EFN56931.1 hypothetical protein CHLNCDRAFT_51198 [Chlorella variabilis]|eukprot:XP_005849033.1 hypothetical protein CHLNCDRAFT_51198 [Chlorella variabilis]
MKVVAAYLLAALGGNAAPGEADIKKILSSVGVEADAERVQKLLSELEGKDVIAAGISKLASVPSGGAVAASGGAAAAAGGAAPAEEKKEEKVEEEEDEDMGFSLFD